MMSSQNLSVPGFMSPGKTPGVHPSRKEFSHADKPGMAHGTRPDLVSGESVWLKKNAPDIFSLRLPDTIWKLPAACYADKKWIFVPDFPASRQ